MFEDIETTLEIIGTTNTVNELPTALHLRRPGATSCSLPGSVRSLKGDAKRNGNDPAFVDPTIQPSGERPSFSSLLPARRRKRVPEKARSAPAIPWSGRMAEQSRRNVAINLGNALAQVATVLTGMREKLSPSRRGRIAPGSGARCPLPRLGPGLVRPLLLLDVLAHDGNRCPATRRREVAWAPKDSLPVPFGDVPAVPQERVCSCTHAHTEPQHARRHR